MVYVNAGLPRYTYVYNVMIRVAISQLQYPVTICLWVKEKLFHTQAPCIIIAINPTIVPIRVMANILPTITIRLFLLMGGRNTFTKPANAIAGMLNAITTKMLYNTACIVIYPR